MKKYMFFIGTLTNGGAERVVSILSSQMAEQGMNVEILTYYDAQVSYKIHPSIMVTSVEKETGNMGKTGKLLWIREYFKENALVVISFLAPFNMLAILANLGTGIPMIVADRNDPRNIPSNPLIRKSRDFLYRFADGIVVQTERNKQYFCKTVQKKSLVIYNPIDLGSDAGIALRTEKKKQIVSVGRLTAQKNQQMLLHVFAKVVKKYPDYELVICGEGPMKEELQALAGNLGIQDHVSLPGNIANVHEYMKGAEMFVLSSDYEGMPNALIEAMCLGLPVVSTKVSGATDLILDHENGLLTEIGSQAELETAMLELIENKDLAKKIAEKSVKLNEKLNLQKIMIEWIDFMNHVISEKR